MTESICRENNCDKHAAASRGWCWGHYERWRKYGDPQAPGIWQAGDTPAVRFWRKVDKSGDCWLWTATTIGQGYGQFWFHGKLELAHRVSWQIHHGRPVPEGLDIEHLCHTKLCVRPEHLQASTHLVNIRRNGNNTKTHCPRGHPYSGDNLYVGPKGGRRCRRCWGPR